jgi:hypothetical protein
MLRKLRKRRRGGHRLRLSRHGPTADRGRRGDAEVKMSLRYLVPLTVMPFEILCVALTTSQTTSVIAEESYPWCTEGETIQCYYMTREQCEEAVNYHGFCISNPNAPTLNTNAAQPRLQRATQGPHLSPKMISERLPLPTALVD